MCQITNHSSQKDNHSTHKSQAERTNGVKATGRSNALSCTSQAASEATSKDSGKLGSRQVVVKENINDSGESSSKVVSRVCSKDAGKRKSSKVVTRLPFEKVKYNRLTNKDARTVDVNTLKEKSTRGTDDKELRRVIDQYKDVFDNDQVGEVQGCDYDIKVSKECVPVIHACRRVPFATLRKINDELDRMERLKVIKKVEKPVPQLFVSRQFVSLLLVFNNSSPLQFVSTTIRLHYNSSPLLFVSTTIRLHYFSSPVLFVSTQFVSNNSSPLLFVSTTIRLQYFSSLDNSSPLIFVSITIRLHYYSSPLLFVPITIRLHYYSFPLLFISTTVRLHYFSSRQNSSPILFVSTAIRINYNSDVYSLVDVINNAGKKSYGRSFVSK